MQWCTITLKLRHAAHQIGTQYIGTNESAIPHGFVWHKREGWPVAFMCLLSVDSSQQPLIPPVVQTGFESQSVQHQAYGNPTCRGAGCTCWPVCSVNYQFACRTDSDAEALQASKSNRVCTCISPLTGSTLFPSPSAPLAFCLAVASASPQMLRGCCWGSAGCHCCSVHAHCL